MGMGRKDEKEREMGKGERGKREREKGKKKSFLKDLYCELQTCFKLSA